VALVRRYADEHELQLAAEPPLKERCRSATRRLYQEWVVANLRPIAPDRDGVLLSRALLGYLEPALVSHLVRSRGLPLKRVGDGRLDLVTRRSFFKNSSVDSRSCCHGGVTRTGSGRRVLTARLANSGLTVKEGQSVRTRRFPRLLAIAALSPVLALAACASNSSGADSHASPSKGASQKSQQGKKGIKNRDEFTDSLQNIFFQGLPQNAGGLESSFAPAYDFDQDSCYPAAAITQLGEINPGLPLTGDITEGCREPADLERTQLYARSICNNGWCAVMYGTYFRKDESQRPIGNPGTEVNNRPSTGTGHTNDWEHAISWINQSTNQVEFVSVTAHGDYHTFPRSEVQFENTHPKIVYHKDGFLTHVLRVADGSDQQVQNASGAWFHPPLVDWNGFPTTKLRDKLVNADFGEAKLDLRDGSFQEHLAKAKPQEVPLNPNG
jgi:hypothetical protein